MVTNSAARHCDFVAIESHNIGLLREFLEIAGSSLTKFRYFDTRPISVIKNHMITLILISQGKAVAYGHLDKEDGIVWLGMMVAENNTGSGFGKMMLARLLHMAHTNHVKSIQLTADNDNVAAINLYSSHGFKVLSRGETISYYKLRIS